MTETPELPIESLRRLARGLVYDRDRAEDVVQEAWLAALRRAPEPAGMRAWLAEAVRRIARSSGRDELRRTAREERAARPEAVPDVAEAVERIEILRRLLDAVEALPEPYRGAVVLRYFDELPPRAIARRLGVPVNTARTHVRRGLERLRRDLDGERGQGRQGLLAALAPFVGPRPWRLVLRELGRSTRTSSSSQEAPMLASKLPIALGLSLAVAATAWLASRPAVHPVTGALAPALVSADGAPSAAGDAQQTPASSNARSPVAPEASAMNAGWIVRGRVLRGSRAPYAGAHVRGRVYAGTQHEGTPLVEQAFAADELGEFAWSIAPPSEIVTVYVEPLDGGFTQPSLWDVFGPGDAAPERWELRVAPLDGVLRGTVSAPDESPIAGARVVYERFPETREIRTDSAGRFELATASIVGVELRVLAAGFAVKRIELERQAGERSCSIRLEPERRLHGRVVDEGGAPLEGVLVSASLPAELDGTTTDAAGRFDLGGIAARDDDLLLWMKKDGYPTTNHSLSPAAVESGQELELRLTHGGMLAGRVVAPDGTPLPGTWVSVGYGAYPSIETYTDAEGRFELGPIWPGLQRLWLWRVGFAQRRHDVRLPAGVARVDGLELALGAPHSLGGVVLDEGGAPIPYAFVWADDPDPRDEHLGGFSMHADAEGRFRFEGLPDVPVQLVVQEPGRAPLRQTVSALDRDDVVLRLTDNAAIAGRVVDDASGAPLSAFTVKIARTADYRAATPIPEGGRSFSDAAGEWRAGEHLEVGLQYWVEITAPGYVAGIGQTTSAVAADPNACVVRLKRGTRVRGLVVDRSTQQPVAGARVERHSIQDNQGLMLTRQATETDASGAFELADVPPGEMTLHVLAPAGGAVDGPFRVADSEPPERWIELGGGGRIAGRLLDAAGGALPGETVAAYGAEVVGDQRDWATTTAADGSFELAGLPSGLYQVHWMRALGEAKVQDLESLVALPAGAERTLELRPRGHATVRGTLTWSEGELPEVVPVRLFPQRAQASRWGDGLRGGLAVRGRFELEGVEPGKWIAVAYPAPREGPELRGSAVIEVPAEGEVAVELTVQPRR